MKPSETETSRPVVLTIAGSDPCCGAGLQADIKVATHLGCYATSVVTALTVQNTQGVAEVWPCTAQQVAEQGRVLLDDIAPRAVKVGMLGSEEVAEAVLGIVESLPGADLVVDTILASTSGMPLYDDSVEGGAFGRLLSRARVITPNLPEAQKLLGGAGVAAEEMAAVLSRKFGGTSVYLKGGHGDGTVLTDLFYNSETGALHRLDARRVDTRNTHGTGCCLSTALACFLSMGKTLDEAARLAHDFTHQSLERGKDFRLGTGHGPTFCQ